MQLSSKVEEAFLRLLQISGQLPQAMSVFRGVEAHDVAKPCVMIHAIAGEEEPLGSGNRFVEASIQIHSLAEPDKRDGSEEELVDDPVRIHNENVLAVDNCLKVSDLPQSLSDSVVDFHVFDPIEDLGCDHTVQDRTFIDTMRWRIYCCPNDLTAV